MSKISTFFIASEENGFRPPALSYKAFLIYGISIIILRLFLGAAPAGSAAVESQTLMTLINTERQSRNLNTLATENHLLTAAGNKAQDMIDRDYFAHVDPDGDYVWKLIAAAGYGSYKILGENLAVDFLTSEGMIKAWLDSPTHRANLLHEEFRDQGLAALYGDYEGRYTNLTASLFGAKQQAPAPKPVPPNPTPPPPTAPPPVVESNQTPPPPEPVPPTPPPAPTPPIIIEPTAPQPAPVVSENIASPASKLIHGLSSSFAISRYIFTLLGVALLVLLGIDSIIIHRHEMAMANGSIATLRSHSSYHLTSFMIIILVSILIWWW